MNQAFCFGHHSYRRGQSSTSSYAGRSYRSKGRNGAARFLCLQGRSSRFRASLLLLLLLLSYWV